MRILLLLFLISAPVYGQKQFSLSLNYGRTYPVGDFSSIAEKGFGGDIALGGNVTKTLIVFGSLGFAKYDDAKYMSSTFEVNTTTITGGIRGTMNDDFGILWGVALGISIFNTSINSPSSYNQAVINEMVQKSIISYEEGLRLMSGSSVTSSETFAVGTLEAGGYFRLNEDLAFTLKDRYNAVFGDGLSSNDILLGISLTL